MIKTIYIFLKLLELVIFYFSGKQLSKTKTNNQYWKVATIPIIVFSLIEGLRFGRMIDYNVYAIRYFTLGNGIDGVDKEYEPLFEFLFTGAYSIGLPYSVFIMFQCFLLIYSILALGKNYKQALPYTLPIVLSLIMMNENFIRWYLGFSFLLLSINHTIKENLYKSLFYILCAVFTHIGFIFFIPFIVFGKYLNKKIISPKIGLLIFILTLTLLSISGMNILITISDILLALGFASIDPTLGSYLSNMDLIINGEAGNLGIGNWDLGVQIRVFVSSFPIIYYAPKVLDNQRYGHYIYNLTMAGIILTPLFSKVELLGRLSDALLFFSSISGGLLFCNVINFPKKSNKYIYIICMLSLLCNIYPYIGNALTRENNDEMLFIWDANGRDFLQY